MIKLISERCPANHLCPLVRACPKGAITQNGFNAPQINQTKCISCKICVNNCPYRCFVF